METGRFSFGSGHPVPRRQIFVCGDLHNLGDLKLLLQNLTLTGGRGGIVRRWASLPEPIERQVLEAGGGIAPGKALLAFAKKAYGAEVVFGGGQLVRDNVSPVALFGLLLAVVSARMGGGRLVTRGLGVSRIDSRLRRWLWRAVLWPCEAVCLRDEASARNLRHLFPGKRHSVHADMAFLPLCSTHAIVPGEEAGRRWLVIAPCIDGSEGRSLEGRGLDAAVEAALQRIPNARIVVACHDPRAQMDKAAAARLVARWPQRDVTVLDGYELSELTNLYREAGLVITNRLHALIFAILADAPAVAIEDGTSKVQAVAGAFAVPVLDRNDASAADRCVTAALSFDRVARSRIRDAAAVRAAGNL